MFKKVFGHGENHVDLSKENTLFNKVVTKINQHQKEQERTIVVTGKNVYNFKDRLMIINGRIHLTIVRK